MAMVLKATITVPWDGRDFEVLDGMRRVLTHTREQIIEIVGEGKLQYDESLSNVREKAAPAAPTPVEPKAGLL